MEAGGRIKRVALSAGLWGPLLNFLVNIAPVLGQDMRAQLLPPVPVVPLPQTNHLGLAELEALALAANPTIPAAQALVDQEQGFLRQAGLYPNPTLGYLRSDPTQSGQSITQGLFYSQEFVLGGKLTLNRAIESQEVRLKTWELDAQRDRVLNDVRIQFLETLGAQHVLEATLELERLAHKNLKLAEQTHKAKVLARADVLRAEIQLQAVRVAVLEARDRHVTAWKQLAVAAGRPDLAPVPLEGDLGKNLPLLDADDSLRALLSNSPLLRAQEARIDAARLQLRRARVEPIPNLTVQLVAEHDQVMKFNTFSTLVALPVPVFNRNQGNVQAAAALIQHEQQEYERVKLALRDQFAASFRQYQSARNQALSLQNEILPRVQENLDLTVKIHQAGEMSFFRVLEAQQMYFDTKLAHLEALIDLRKIAQEITGLLLTGGLNPSEIGAALQSRQGAGASLRNLLLNQLREQGSSNLRILPGAIQGGPSP